MAVGSPLDARPDLAADPDTDRLGRRDWSAWCAGRDSNPLSHTAPVLQTGATLPLRRPRRMLVNASCPQSHSGLLKATHAVAGGGLEPPFAPSKSAVLPTGRACKMAPGRGLEPRFPGSEPSVLPVDEPRMSGSCGIQTRDLHRDRVAASVPSPRSPVSRTGFAPACWDDIRRADGAAGDSRRARRGCSGAESLGRRTL
jgi:hypothetical protein